MGLGDPGAAARNSIKVQGATLVILRHCDDRVKDSAANRRENRTDPLATG